jgi:hypothetical protein
MGIVGKERYITVFGGNLCWKEASWKTMVQMDHIKMAFKEIKLILTAFIWFRLGINDEF